MPHTEIEKINTKLDTLVLEFGTLKTDIKDIKGYIYNDTRVGKPGLIQKVTDMEVKVDALEEASKNKKTPWLKTFTSNAITTGIYALKALFFIKKG